MDSSLQNATYILQYLGYDLQGEDPLLHVGTAGQGEQLLQGVAGSLWEEGEVRIGIRG